MFLSCIYCLLLWVGLFSFTSCFCCASETLFLCYLFPNSRPLLLPFVSLFWLFKSLTLHSSSPDFSLLFFSHPIRLPFSSSHPFFTNHQSTFIPLLSPLNIPSLYTVFTFSALLLFQPDIFSFFSTPHRPLCPHEEHLQQPEGDHEPRWHGPGRHPQLLPGLPAVHPAVHTGAGGPAAHVPHPQRSQRHGEDAPAQLRRRVLEQLDRSRTVCPQEAQVRSEIVQSTFPRSLIQWNSWRWFGV